MDSYKILFKRSAERELRKVPNPFIARLVKEIAALAIDPRPPGVQMLKGEGRYFRLRQGDYRVIYDVDDKNRAVTIIKIGHRREVYD